MTKDKDDIKYIIIQAWQAENKILDEAEAPPPLPPPLQDEINCGIWNGHPKVGL